MTRFQKRAGATMLNLKTQVQNLAQGSRGTVSVSIRNISNAFDFALDDGIRMGSASTIKVPIIVEAMRQVRDGNLSLDTEYRVSREQRCPGSGVIAHLHEGISVTLRDLLTLMIITSDNTATNMCIDIVGLDNVNVMLREFGCTATTLNRKMYDWDSLAQGKDNWVVAREMTSLLVKIARNEAVSGGYDKLILDIMHNQLYSDVLGQLLPEGVLANKTGSVNNVIHDCGVVRTPEFSYAIGVFTQDIPLPGEARITIGRISKLIFDVVSAGKSC